MQVLKIYLFPQKSYNYGCTGRKIIFHRTKEGIIIHYHCWRWTCLNGI